MGIPNNPAGRLHGILTRALAIGKRGVHPAIKVWPEVLKVAPGPDDVLLARIARALELPFIIKRQVESIPNENHGEFLSWVPTVSKVFTRHNFDESFNHFIAGIDAHVLSLVFFCDNLLSKHHPERTITEDQLSKLQAELDRFTNEVRESDIDEMLKDYLRHHADLIDRAIGDYNIIGINSIDKAVESCAGAIFARKPIVDEVLVTPVGKSFSRIVLAFLMGVGASPGIKELSVDLSLMLPQAEVEVMEVVEPKSLLAAEQD